MMKCVSLVFILASSMAMANGLVDLNRPVWSMGMGGVAIPFPRDVDMPTINAAYLTHVQEVGVELITVNAGGPGLTQIQELQDLPPLDSFADLNDYFGRPVWAGLGQRYTIVLPYFGISGTNNMSVYTYVNNPLVPEMYVNYLSDSGIYASFGIPGGPGSSFGVTLKRLTRRGGARFIDYALIDEYIQTEDSDVILDEFSDRGIAYGGDISYLYRPSDHGPIFTLVWRDLGYTTFQRTGGVSSPPSQHENLILGLGYDYQMTGFGFRTGLEYRNITTQNMQLGKKLHMGAEVSLPLIDLRAGLNQGYSTFGFGLDLWLLRFEAAQYTEELGVYPGQRPDQRIQVAITLDLSVDANFRVSGRGGDGGADSRRRKLKQRR